MKWYFLYEVAEDRLEARPRVRKACRRREARARADDDRVGLLEGALQALALRVGEPRTAPVPGFPGQTCRVPPSVSRLAAS